MQEDKACLMLVFLDVETTGLDQEDKICSLAVISVDKDSTIVKYDLVDEGKKIPPKASSINHITNEMINGKPKLNKSEAYIFLENLNTPETTIVGHNVNFDLAMLSSNGFKFKGKIIDTLRVSKHLIPECESYSLQFLRYELKLYKNEKEKMVPHHALSDAFVVKALFEYLLASSSLEDMWNLSFKNVLMQKLNFGKYSGQYIEEICSSDRGYLEWVLNSLMDLDEDLRYSIDYYLRG